MARGTFRKVGLKVGGTFRDVRKAFGRQASEYAKKYLEEIVNSEVPENLREAVLSDPGDAWLYAVKYVYKTFARLLKDKADAGTLRLSDGKFNVDYDEVKRALPDEARTKIVSALKALTI